MGRRVVLLANPDTTSLCMWKALRSRFDVRLVPYTEPFVGDEIRDADLVFSTYLPPRRLPQRLRMRHWSLLARRHGVPNINAYPAQYRWRRDRMMEAWNRAGIPCPRAAPFRGRRGLLRALERVGLPALVRNAYGHCGTRIHRVETVEEAFDVAPHYGVALEFVDVEGADGWTRRYRAAVLGDRVVPVDVYAAPGWLVNSHHYLHDILHWVSGPGASEVRAYGEAEEVMHADVLRQATRALGADCCAIDFAERRDGTPVLFEANLCWGWWEFRIPHHNIAIRRQKAALADYVEEWLEHRQTESTTVAPDPVRLET